MALGATTGTGLNFFGGSGAFGKEGFPSPWFDMATLAMPENFKNALEWCFVPGTLVELAGLQFEPIESLEECHTVLTRTGQLRRVDRTHRREVCEELVVVNLAGYGRTNAIRLTGQHKLRRFPNPGKGQWPGKIDEEVLAEDLQVGDFIGIPLPLRQCVAAETQDVSQPPRYTGWLLGMYVAEACTTYNRETRLQGVRFTLGADDEVSGVVSRLLSEIDEQVGQQLAAYTPPSRPDIRLVTCNDADLPDWLLEHGGRYAKEKRLHGAVLGYSDEFILGLIGGWLDGDGCINCSADKFKGLLGTTASRVLAYQMMRLANCVGLSPGMTQDDNGDTKTTFGVPGGKSWQLLFGKEDSLRLAAYSVKGAAALVRFGEEQFVRQREFCRVLIRDGYVYRRVVGIDREEYVGDVCGLRVTGDDHSYIAGGMTALNCEYIFQANGTYRMAMERIIAYFLTDIEIGSADPRDSLGDDEKEKWNSFLLNTLGMLGVIQDMDRDRLAYGNAFATMMVPFRRLLSCPKCGNAWPFHVVSDTPDFGYRFQGYEFTATCPSCKTGSGYHGKFNVNDLPDNLEKKLKVKIWNPHQMEIVHDLFTGDCSYVWRIPEDYKRKVRMGDPYTLERIPLPVLRAVQANSLYRFAPDAMYHMKEASLGGVINRGWGMPRTLTNFRDIWYVQVLRRYNEAIALDYVIPFRVITPMPRPGSTGGMTDGVSSDPLIGTDMGEFVPQVMRMIAARRRNPAQWNALPFPVQYQALGGDAKSFAPADMMNQGLDTLLNAAGTPSDLYKGTLQLQVAPVALRLFEATFHHLVHGNNDFLRWAINQVAQLLSWEMIAAKLKRVTHADDFQRQQAQLQLMMGQAISQTSGLKGIGMDWKDEQRLIAEESRYQAQLQSEVQEEMEQASFGQQIAKGQAGGAQPPGGGGASAGGGGGQPAPGGAPGQPPGPVSSMEMSGNTPVTPNDLMEQAASLAQQLLALPESQKKSELIALKKKNETLWSVVRAKMDQMRQKAQTAGGAAMLGQQPNQPQQ